MNDPKHTLEPLAPELEALISAAAVDDGPSEETAARLYARLSSTLALPPAPFPFGAEQTGIAAQAAALLPSAKALVVSAVVASGMGVGGVAVYMGVGLSPSEPPAVVSTRDDGAAEPTLPTTVSEEAPEERPAQSGPPAAPEVAPDPIVHTAKGKRATSVGETRPAERGPAKTTMADERRLIEAARRALDRGAPNQALRHLSRHRQQFGQGRFVEERDVLHIISLAQLGRIRAAKRSAALFFEEYPSTVFKDAVDAALRGAPR